LSSNRELINPSELHPAPGFSHIALANGSRLAFVAGQVALGQDFSIIGEGDLGQQTEAAMRNLGTALAAIGATFEDVVRRTIYTTRPTEFETITTAIEKVQGSSEHPPQTIAGVSGLALPGLLIEIEATVSLS
jgi:enamine deaminase RidA (YjgF/YER057c/UK114 family)